MTCASLFLDAMSLVRLLRNVLDSLKLGTSANPFRSRWVHIRAAPPDTSAPPANLFPHFAHSPVPGDAAKRIRVCAKALRWTQNCLRIEDLRQTGDGSSLPSQVFRVIRNRSSPHNLGDTECDC